MGTAVTVITRPDYLTFLHPLSIQPPLHSSILQLRMADSDHSMTITILYLLLLPAATLGRTTESPVCQDNGCETYYGGDARCVFVRHGNWSQIGREYVLGTVDKEGLCHSQNDLDDCCRCLPVRTSTTTTTSTTSTPPPGCTDVLGSCRAAFNGSGSCIDVRQDDLTYIDIDVDPLDGHCGAGPDKCCECFKLKTEAELRLTSYPKGRVELYKNGKWGTLCGHYWWDNQKGAENICRQLGYTGGTKYTAPGGTGPIQTGNRLCEGGEATIWDCPLKRGELEGCTHDIDQGVTCCTTKDNYVIN